MDFTRPIHNAVLQEILTVKNELPLLEMINVKRIIYNIEALEAASKADRIRFNHHQFQSSPKQLKRKSHFVNLKTLRTQILCNNCKSELILKDGMFNFEKCDKISSEKECLKIWKVAFILKASCSMQIFRKKELGNKTIKARIKKNKTITIEDRTADSR